MAKNNKPELVIEQHPETYTGLKFLSLVKFQDDYLLCVIDNIDEKTLRTFVLDYCTGAGINESEFILLVNEWWESVDYRKLPLSIFLSKRGYAEHSSKIFREFDISNVVRIVGPVSYYEMKEIDLVRKRKRSKKKNNKSNTNNFRLLISEGNLVYQKLL